MTGKDSGIWTSLCLMKAEPVWKRSLQNSQSSRMLPMFTEFLVSATIVSIRMTTPAQFSKKMTMARVKPRNRASKTLHWKTPSRPKPKQIKCPNYLHLLRKLRGAKVGKSESWAHQTTSPRRFSKAIPCRINPLTSGRLGLCFIKCWLGCHHSMKIA